MHPNLRTATSTAEATATSNSPTVAGAPSIDVSTSDRGAAGEGTPRVVIVGGGFGGIAAANWLKRVPVQVMLIDRTNYHLFQPLLYQVAAGVLEPGTIAIPIRSMFRGQANVDIRMGEVIAIDKGRRCVQLNGEREPILYDYLILATGSHSTHFGHDDWAPFAPGMKTLSDGEGLRRRIVGALEKADCESDPCVREQWLTFVLVGAGPTGCELAGELAEQFRRALPAEYRHIDPRRARIILVEAGPRALSMFSEDLVSGAMDKLRSLGVDVRLGHAVERVDAEGVVIAGERVAARTVIWTAGVSASPAASWLGVETDHAGRVLVGPELSVPGYPASSAG
jgi:NADH:ubiquinone reductase (H+-translocating)